MSRSDVMLAINTVGQLALLIATVTAYHTGIAGDTIAIIGATLAVLWWAVSLAASLGRNE